MQQIPILVPLISSPNKPRLTYSREFYRRPHCSAASPLILWSRNANNPPTDLLRYTSHLINHYHQPTMPIQQVTVLYQTIILSDYLTQVNIILGLILIFVKSVNLTSNKHYPPLYAIHILYTLIQLAILKYI